MYTWERPRKKWGDLEFRIKYHHNKEREWDLCLLGESKWFFGKINGSLEEQMWDGIICDTVCPDVVSTSPLLSCNKSQNSLVDETPWKAIFDNQVPSGGSVFR